MEVVILSGNNAQSVGLSAWLRESGHLVTTLDEQTFDLAALLDCPEQLVIMEVEPARALALCQNIRAQPLGERLFILVSLPTPNDASSEACLDAGADDYLSQPYQRGDVLGRMRVAQRALKARAKSLVATARSSKTISSLVDHSPVGIARIREVDGSIVDANPELCRMLGMTLDAVRSASAQFLVSLVEPASSPLSREAVSLDFARKSEPFNLLRPDGQTLRMLLSTTRYEDEDGWFTVLILHDVTEREQLRHQLLLAERMASLGVLAAGVAHEINNPLSCTMTNLHYLSEMLSSLAGKLDGEGNKEPLVESSAVRAPVRAMLDALNEAIDASGRVRDIVMQLRDLSRSDDVLEQTSVEPIIERALLLVSNELSHRARIVCDFAEPLSILTSPGKLGQVIVNLLVNASQAMESNPQENEIRISTRRKGERVEIDVSDNGQGIPPDNLRRIFEPFFTTKAVGVGTGLGLSICHALVSSLGGQIEASSLGRGATFRITLPAMACAGASAPTGAQSAAEPKTPRGRLLVIDDEPGLGRSLQRVLSRSHETTVIASAREALGRLLGGESFDLIFCDIMMPEMSGIELFEALNESRADLAAKLVFMTGGAFTPAARSFLASVKNERLYKPIDLQELRRVVASHLSRH